MSIYGHICSTVSHKSHGYFFFEANNPLRNYPFMVPVYALTLLLTDLYMVEYLGLEHRKCPAFISTALGRLLPVTL